MARPLDDESLRIECREHAASGWSVVCRHHVEARDHDAVGFVENSSDPEDLQAWCDECEARFLEEGGLTDAFRAFNRFAVVCVDCYRDLELRHSRRPS